NDNLFPHRHPIDDSRIVGDFRWEEKGADRCPNRAGWLPEKIAFRIATHGYVCDLAIQDAAQDAAAGATFSWRIRRTRTTKPAPREFPHPSLRRPGDLEHEVGEPVGGVGE